MTAFTGCRDAQPLINGLGRGVDCVLYEELNDPTGVAVLAMTENPELLVTKLRQDLTSGPFKDLIIKQEFAMLGRTYALGYEPKLEDWLLHRLWKEGAPEAYFLPYARRARDLGAKVILVGGLRRTSTMEQILESAIVQGCNLW